MGHGSIGVFFIFLNLFQTWQFNTFILDGYSTTKAYYWRIFLKTSVDAEDRKLMEIQRDYASPFNFSNKQDYNHRTAGMLNFDDVNTAYYNEAGRDSTVAFSAPFSYKISPDVKYGPTYRIPYNHLTFKEHAWINISFRYYSDKPIEQSGPILVAEMNHNDGQYIEGRFAYEMKDYPFRPDQWNEFSTDYLTPFPLSEENDVFLIYVYVSGSEPIYIDDFKLEVYERKW